MASNNIISKWAIYDNQIIELFKCENPQKRTIARQVLINNNIPVNKYSIESLRCYIKGNEKKFTNGYEGVKRATESMDVNIQNVKHLWMKDKGASLFIKNADYVEPEVQRFKDLTADLIKDLQQYIPKFPVLKREVKEDSYLLVIDPADIHIGKLCSAFETGEDYNSQIAVSRVLEGVKGILQKVSSFNIDKILFIGGNDVLHVDNPKHTTTSGTIQDVDGMWYDNFMIAKKMYIDLLEILLGVADIHFVFSPSNHDFTSGFFLSQVIETYFKDSKNITFDVTMAHRKGYKYHSNLIGVTHGDGAKIDLLPLLMAQEFSKEWAETKHRYVYTHHIHHKHSKDLVGVTIESLRSPSGTDSWHHRQGFQHAPQAVEGFLHCKKHGQIARITNLF
jgi:hypothetical protein